MLGKQNLQNMCNQPKKQCNHVEKTKLINQWKPQCNCLFFIVKILNGKIKYKRIRKNDFQKYKSTLSTRFWVNFQIQKLESYNSHRDELEDQKHIFLWKAEEKVFVLFYGLIYCYNPHFSIFWGKWKKIKAFFVIGTWYRIFFLIFKSKYSNATIILIWI